MQYSRQRLKSRESHMPGSRKYVRGSYMCVSYDAPPLDFSFKEIESLHDLLYEKQRKGRNKDRKPIIELKVDKKKKGQQEKEEKEFDEESIDNELEEGESDEDKDEESKDEEGEEKKKKDEIEVGKLIPVDTHMDLANKHNISLAPNQGMTFNAQNKDGMGKKRKKKVKLVCSSLILMSNKIPQDIFGLINFKSDLDDFYNIVDQVMVDSYNLRWLDLSHNVFSELTLDFGNFEQLMSLYLHCNKIRDMQELVKLQNITKLRTLTIHGNPLDQLPNFRIYIIGILPNLKRLDTVLVTYKETDNALVWRDTFQMTRMPCVPLEEEDLKKAEDDDEKML